MDGENHAKIIKSGCEYVNFEKIPKPEMDCGINEKSPKRQIINEKNGKTEKNHFGSANTENNAKIRPDIPNKNIEKISNMIWNIYYRKKNNRFDGYNEIIKKLGKFRRHKKTNNRIAKKMRKALIFDVGHRNEQKEAKFDRGREKY